MFKRFKHKFNSLFGAAKSTKNVDSDKYGCSGCGIGFYSRSQSLWTDGSLIKNVVNFGVDNSSFVHVGNKKKDISVLN